MSERRYAVVAGGGTGGHVVPALAVAHALVERGHEAGSIQFFGTRRGAGSGEQSEFPTLLLSGRGLRRSVAPGALIANVGAVFGLVGAVVRAVIFFGRTRPRVAVVLGGYASVAAGTAAVAARVPLVVVNIDAVPGLANRVLGRFARASAVAFPGTALRHATVTGTPVRTELSGLDTNPAAVAAARSRLGIPPENLTIAVFGGSLGARSINRAARALAVRWADRSGITIFHVSGRRDFAAFAAEGDPAAGGTLTYRLVDYEADMATLYAASDLCICRSGAMTVAELAAVGRPAVLVPLPGAPSDHQSANARALVEAGAALVLSDAECDGEHLDELVGPLVADPTRLGAMGAAAAALFRPDAAARVAEVVEASAR